MFLTDLVVKRDVEKDDCWIVEKNLTYLAENMVITVKPGFDFDFASIPAVVRGLIPTNGQEYDRAACIHDALYASHLVDKATADKLFYRAMLEDGVNKGLASMMYTAVKLFGGLAYQEGEEDVPYYQNLVEVRKL